MNVLSLFDGMSCGMIALERAGISVKNYYAAEVDKNAIKISKHNYPSIKHIGDVTKVKYADGVLYTENGSYDVGKIDLIIGGSPCQGFSMAGKQLAFDDPRSILYFEYERLKNETNATYFLLENVKMKQEFKEVISDRLGVQPIAINSNLVSAQNRYRLYWTNIPNVEQPKDRCTMFSDIVQDNVSESYFIKGGRLRWLCENGASKEKEGYVAFNPAKAKCLTVRREPSWNTTYLVNGAAWRGQYVKGEVQKQLNIHKDGKANCLVTCYHDKLACVSLGGDIRKLTPEECEILQTVPVGYTSCVPDSHRYKALGNGWTVDVVAHIFSYLKGDHATNQTSS